MDSNQEPIQTPLPGPTYKDRRGGLIFFGVLQLLIAAVIFVLAGLVLLVPSEAIAKSQPPGAPPVSFAMISGFYGLVGLLFATLGIGSISAKNWARLGTLIVCWFWLVTGIFSLLFTLLLLPAVLKTAPQPQQNLPPNLEHTVRTVITLFMSLFFIVLPGIFLIFYHGKNVKATTLSRQGANRSSSRSRPALMTVLIVLFGFSLISVPFALFSKYPVVIFGHVFWGWLGKIIFFVAISAELYAMWAYIKLDIKGWWVALAANVFWICSTIVTFTGRNIFELYRQMGLNEQQLSIFQAPHFWAAFLTLLAGFMSLRLAAIAYSKRYFPKPGA